jgi:hypothetical protein
MYMEFGTAELMLLANVRQKRTTYTRRRTRPFPSFSKVGRASKRLRCNAPLIRADVHAPFLPSQSSGVQANTCAAMHQLAAGTYIAAGTYVLQGHTCCRTYTCHRDIHCHRDIQLAAGTYTDTGTYVLQGHTCCRDIRAAEHTLAAGTYTCHRARALPQGHTACRRDIH